VQPDVLPLVPVCSEHFAHRNIESEEGLSAQQFCTENCLNTTALNIFLTVEHLPERMRAQPPRDVILMDRVFKELHVHSYHALLIAMNVNIIGDKGVIHWSICSSNA
jgi:hypothetical protein